MTVERIGKRSQTYNLGYLHLCRDDIEDLMQAMKDFGGNSAKAIVNGKVTLTEPKDFADLPGDIPENLESVAIRAKNGSSEVALHLGAVRYSDEGTCSVELVDPDQHSHGVRAQIEEICKPRRRRFSVEAKEQAPKVMAPLFMALALGMFFSYTPDGAYSMVLRLLLAFAVSFWPCFILWKLASRYWKTDITNAYRAQRPTHWQQHRVTYIASTVTLLLGGVIGHIVNQIP